MSRRVLLIVVTSAVALVLVGGGIWLLRNRSINGVQETPIATESSPEPTPEVNGSTVPPPVYATNTSIAPKTLPDGTRIAGREVVARDQDGDGLSDADEAAIGTDAQKEDTDGDRLSDHAEVFVYRTDPFAVDALDGEGKPVRIEYWSTTTRSGVTAPSASMSTSTNAPIAPVEEDRDRDGLSATQEVQLGTDDQKADTDGDGLSDREEAQVYRTDPTKADSDEDSFLDAQEIQSGYNPLGSGRCIRPDCIP